VHALKEMTNGNPSDTMLEKVNRTDDDNPMTPDRLIAKCKSWRDFSEAMLPLTNKQKGDAFERLTQRDWSGLRNTFSDVLSVWPVWYA
jgi:hypothetical protein